MAISDLSFLCEPWETNLNYFLHIDPNIYPNVNLHFEFMSTVLNKQQINIYAMWKYLLKCFIQSH